jgi:hypothetical protein
MPRLQVPGRQLDLSIDLNKKWVPLVPAELIFNLDETGLSDWEDSSSKPVLVPTNLGDLNDSLSGQSPDQTPDPPVLYLCF